MSNNTAAAVRMFLTVPAGAPVQPDPALAARDAERVVVPAMGPMTTGGGE